MEAKMCFKEAVKERENLCESKINIAVFVYTV